MFRTKKDVDRHVQDIFRKITNEDERNHRSYNIAKLYYQVGDYESAKRYISIYLEKRDNMPGAHKLYGQILEALGQKEAALTEYKISLELDARQDDLVLKVCELLADMDISIDINRARYWVERADKQCQHHPIVFQLKEKMLTIDKTSNGGEDLESLIKSELSVRPNDVQLHIKLLRYYMDKMKYDEAYNYACSIENSNAHRNSIAWYQILCELLWKCKNGKQTDFSFWVTHISALERFTALCFKEQGNMPHKVITEATQAVFSFDQVLFESKKLNLSNNPNTFMEEMLMHMWAQLHYHLACLILMKTNREQGSWSDAGRLCSLLLLTALHVPPVDPIAPWATHLKERTRNLVQIWHKEGAYRCSQAAHVIQDYARDGVKGLMSQIDNFCTKGWRERIYKRIFTFRIFQKSDTSFFVQHKVADPPLRLCSQNELRYYDEISESVWPMSLHHQVWLGIKSRPLSKANSNESGPHPHQYSHIFPELQFSVYNLNQAAPDTLSRLDIDAFLNAAVLCALAIVEQQQRNSFLNPQRLPTLPADLTNTLCTVSQEKWWTCAYKLYHKKDELSDDIGEVRQELQRGLEVIRCIGNHGLHPKILIHLGRIFQYRVKVLKEKDKEHVDIPALEARSELYWSTAIPLLERLLNNQIIRSPNMKLFNYEGKEMSNLELTNALEEGKLLIAQKYVRNGQDEQAIETLKTLKSPDASFQQAKIYKKLADEINSLPKENITSEMRAQCSRLMAKARGCLHLTLDRLRSPDTDPKHPLNSEIYTYLSEVENEIANISSDLYPNLSKTEFEVVSDESFTSAHSAEESPVIINSSAYAVINSTNTTNSILKNSVHRTPKQSSTPCKLSQQNILEMSRGRIEARPSPERLDAQMRQLLSRDNSVFQALLEQNKALIEQNRNMNDKLEKLTKEVSDLKLEVQKNQTNATATAAATAAVAAATAVVSSTPQSIANRNNHQEELTDIREEDYGDYYAAVSAAQPIGPPPTVTKGSYGALAGYCSPGKYLIPLPPTMYPMGVFPGAHSPQAAPPPPMFPPPRVYPSTPVQPMYPNAMYQPMASLDDSHSDPTVLNNMLQIRESMMAPSFHPSERSSSIEHMMTGINIPKDAPVNRSPPVNVVITSSDTLPTSAPTTRPTLSVTIPAHHRLGAVSLAPTQVSVAPHSYQISMPSQATIPTTVKLPLFNTFTTTTSNLSSNVNEKANLHNVSTDSQNTSTEVCSTSEHDPLPDFVPVIPLPAEVAVTTGEEDETTLFCARARLYRFADKEWKERGIGNVKLLRNAEGKVRLLMRRDQVLKICANHFLRHDMVLSQMPKNDKAWAWVANDFADEEVKLEKFCIRFKTVEEAQEFKKIFDESCAGLPVTSSPEKSEGKVASTEQKTLTTSAVTVTSETISAGISTVSTVDTTSVAPQVKVGGFSFTGKPIIQKQQDDNATKTVKAEEPPKPSPFASFSFVKADTNVVDNNESTKAENNAKAIIQPSKFAWDAAEKEDTSTTIGTTATLTVTSTSSPVTTNNSIVPSNQSTLRRPHTPATKAQGNQTALVEYKATFKSATGQNIETWADFGIVQAQILKEPVTGNASIFVRKEDHNKVICNQPISDDITFTLNNDTVHWAVKDNNRVLGKPNIFALIFQKVEHASQFYKASLDQQLKTKTKSTHIAKTTDKSKQSQPLSELFKPPAGSWECSACYTRNTASSVKCVSCESLSPNQQDSNTAQATNKPPLSELFKPPVGSWECSACYTRNESSNNKCVSCQTPSQTSVTKQTSDKPPLSQLFSKPSGSWECKQCYVVNDVSKSYCAACDNPKDPSMPPKPKTSGFNVGSTAPTGLTFSFGVPQSTAKDTTKTTGFSFQMPNNKGSGDADTSDNKLIFGSKLDTSTAGFTFGVPQQRPVTPPKTDGPFTFGSPGKPFDFQFQVKSPVKSPGGGGENSEEEVAESEDVYFAPVIPLPDKIDVKTGEENEYVLYSHRAKLFRYDSNTKVWKERGLGDIKLLRHKDTNKLRLVMRRDQILKLCLNHFVTPDLEITSKDDKTWLWTAADYSEGEIEYSQFACRFKTPEIAQQFKKAIDDAVKSDQISDKSKQNDIQKDIQILYEVKVTPEEKAAALKLQLPENFYAYKRKEDCPGCIGCQEPAYEFTRAESKPKEVKPVTTKTQSICGAETITKTSERTTSTVNFDSTTFGQKVVPEKSDKFVFGSQSALTAPKESSFSIAKAAVSDEQPLENLKICSPKTSSKPVFGEATSTTNIFSGTASATPTFGASMFDGKQTSGETVKPSFGSIGEKVQSQSKSFFAGSGSQKPNEGTSIFDGSGTQSEAKAIFGDSGKQAQNKPKLIFGSSENQSQNESKSIFDGSGKQALNETKLIFGSSVSQAKNETKSIFGGFTNQTQNETKSIFGDSVNQTQSETTSIFDTSKTQIQSKPNTKFVFSTSTPSSNIFGSSVTPVFGASSILSSQIPNTNKTQNKENQPVTTSADNTSTTSVVGATIPVFGGVGNSSSIFGSVLTTPNPSIFGGKQTDEKSKQEAPMPSFLSSDNAISFSAFAAKNSQQPSFKIDPNFAFEGAGTALFSRKSLSHSSEKKNMNESKTAVDESKEEEGDHDNEQEHDPYFEPIVPLPDAIEVRTGEEDEEKVFCERAKLYRYDTNLKEWKERGVGEMKILYHAGHGTYRLLLRREQVYKVVCNLLITPDLKFSTLNSSDRAWMWAGMNYAEEAPAIEELAVRFKSPELAAQFKNAIDEAQQALRVKQFSNKGKSNNTLYEENVYSQEAEYEVDEEEDEDIHGDVDEEKVEDEECEEEDENTLIFHKRATLFVKGDTSWNLLAVGDLQIIYDSDIFGARILLKADETGEIVSNTVISLETLMQVIDNTCIWSTIDDTVNPPVRRTIKAVFSSNAAADEMYTCFREGLEYAKHFDTTEPLEDYIPSEKLEA